MTSELLKPKEKRTAKTERELTTEIGRETMIEIDV